MSQAIESFDEERKAAESLFRAQMYLALALHHPGGSCSAQAVEVLRDAIFHTSNGGASWVNETTTQRTLNAVAGTTSTSPALFAVGTQVWQYGGTWMQISQTLPSPLTCLTAQLGFGTVYVAGAQDGNIYGSDYDGVVQPDLRDWLGNPSERHLGQRCRLLHCGAGGRILHGNASGWGTPAQSSGTSNELKSVYGVVGGQAGNYWAVGSIGTILFSSGSGSWSPQPSNTTAEIRGVWQVDRKNCTPSVMTLSRTGASSSTSSDGGSLV